MQEIRGKSAVVIGSLYVAFVAWSFYGAVFPVETHTFRLVHLGLIFGLAFRRRLPLAHERLCSQCHPRPAIAKFDPR